MPTLTDEHRLAQSRLAAATVRQMLTVWPVLQLDNLDGSYEAWLRAVTPIVGDLRADSAALAGGYYTTLRDQRAHLADPFSPTLAGIVDAAALATSMLVTGPVKVKQAIARGVTLDEASQLGMVASARAASRHVLTGGRQTILDSQRHDHAALGYARVGSGRPCAFCAMLISRGPVYKTEKSATVTRDGRRYHDDCHCAAEPVFDGEAWDGRAQFEHYRDLWEASTGDADTPDEARAAFRHATDAEQSTAPKTATGGAGGGFRPPRGRSVASGDVPDPMEFSRAVELWTDENTYGAVRLAAEQIAVTGRVADTEASHAARRLMQQLEEHGRPSPVILRGEPGELGDGDFRPGERLAWTLKSFSERPQVARFFANGNLIVELPAGTKALPVGMFSEHPHEAEWLVGGVFEVVRFERVADKYSEYRLWLRQILEP